MTAGNNITLILLIYVAITIGLFYAFDSYKNGETFQPILFGLIGIINSLNNLATPIIDRQKIKEVKLKKAIKGLTRSRFEILFEDESGKIKKRLIMLPGSLTDGQNETENASRIIKEENLLKQNNEMPTKAICNKGFSGNSSILPCSNFGVV